MPREKRSPSSEVFFSKVKTVPLSELLPNPSQPHPSQHCCRMLPNTQPGPQSLPRELSLCLVLWFQPPSTLCCSISLGNLKLLKFSENQESLLEIFHEFSLSLFASASSLSCGCSSKVSDCESGMLDSLTHWPGSQVLRFPFLPLESLFLCYDLAQEMPLQLSKNQCKQSTISTISIINRKKGKITLRQKKERQRIGQKMNPRNCRQVARGPEARPTTSQVGHFSSLRIRKFRQFHAFHPPCLIVLSAGSGGSSSTSSCQVCLMGFRTQYL